MNTAQVIEIKSGAKLLLMFTVTRPAKTGEIYYGDPINNRYGNFWWAKADNLLNPTPILICTDLPIPPVPKGITGYNFRESTP